MADVTVNTDGLDNAANRFARAVDKTLRTWAFEVERRAKIKSPIDTGFNANSIYTVTPDGKISSNGRQLAERPDPGPRKSKKHPGRNYQPGTFALQAPIESAAGYQEILRSIAGSTNVQVMGGAQKLGPSGAHSPDLLVAEVRVGSEYGLYLEMGTFRMRARPFLGPAAAEVTPRFDGLLRKNLEKEGLI